ncbi:MAG TPA: RNA 2',3'-cyclic phosphodiesterase [Terriglobales bacterium]
MRLFVALDIDEEIREKIAAFVEQVHGLAPDARWVGAASLHVTLKFIGEKPDEKAKDIESTLVAISSQPFAVSFRGCGFFPTPRSARVFWVGIEAGPELSHLAQAVEDALTKLGIPEEKREFSPHLTLARTGGGSGAPGWRKGDKPSRQFARLQQRLGEIGPPEFGTMTAREFFLYRSQLSPKGSQYTKLARFPLAVAQS